MHPPKGIIKGKKLTSKDQGIVRIIILGLEIVKNKASLFFQVLTPQIKYLKSFGFKIIKSIFDGATKLSPFLSHTNRKIDHLGK